MSLDLLVQFLFTPNVGETTVPKQLME